MFGAGLMFVRGTLDFTTVRRAPESMRKSSGGDELSESIKLMNTSDSQSVFLPDLVVEEDVIF